ncbi:alpha-1,4-glucan--maltose-1-phosphate maltosyltransferase [Fodinicola acaciae]|uniref:alpha-1,4-glucan--maltose-1-phosphate maltosyltransferase n=1 Tax=Fodinicola acaciae TaxID=2681555 RepID=UPI0013CF76D6|nr:alpha-1,4-glucan--maltose-1-phosphate maltosyltransferase [Fodinicola acaciae]
MSGRIPIEDISPSVACGRYPARAVVGEYVPVAATVYREGHDAVGANVVWKGPDGRRRRFVRMEQGPAWTSRWYAGVIPDEPGRWTFAIEAWSDPYATWRHAVEVKMEAGQGSIELANDLAEGVSLMQRASQSIIRIGGDLARDHRGALADAARSLADTSLSLEQRVKQALDLGPLLHEIPLRELITRSATHTIWVDRQRALYGSWYEFFPRSEGALVPDPTHPESIQTPVHGTLRTAAERLPAIADMGFDVVYLPPIHPIGEVNRKGPNNTLHAGPDDVGSPWAIGSKDGGHDAIHPRLGTFDDFDAFVARTHELGMEVALDLALQCAPDHPWVTEHPQWFTTKADGTIAYAENPPKKYQDIYPLNFDNDPDGIYQAVLAVVRKWISHGVKIFRVDNPHTKPVNFWHWLIAEVKSTDPDVLFLAEAFTRSAMMHGLAKIGFTQSYTYFTWRTGKQELIDYANELVAAADYMRPNFFVNTPDILHDSLQYGGPPMFKIRAVLGSLLSPSWGVYSGYELYEHVAVRPGSEEYLDSEKYQLRPRDWARAAAEHRTLAPYLKILNEFRREHPATHWLRNLRFHQIDNDVIMCWSKVDHATGDTVLVVVSLDPHDVQWGNTALDMPALGLDWNDRFRVVDRVTGAEYDWGQFNAVRLDPHDQPAHLFAVHKY